MQTQWDPLHPPPPSHTSEAPSEAQSGLSRASKEAVAASQRGPGYLSFLGASAQ